MTCKTCKDCPARSPACHDNCERFAAWRAAHEAETTYTRKMLDPGKVYHYGSDDKHRGRGRKLYMGKNGGADR